MAIIVWLADFGIFLISGLLLLTITARLKFPVNLIAAAITILILARISMRLTSGLFTGILAGWLVLVVISIYVLRWYLKESHGHHVQQAKK